MMKRGYLILNPSAGIWNKSNAAIFRVLREFEKHGIRMSPSPTEPKGSTVQQVRELLVDEPDLLVVWGGDGTINEVINGMYGSDIPLGILPGGTANVMVRELKIPTQVSRAVQVILSGKTRKISIGQANKRYFSLMAGIGFDSEVIRNVDWNLKKTMGTLAFGVSMLNSARTYNFPKFHVKVGSEKKECVFAVISNARGYAAYFQIAPQADISDEYLYLSLFKEAGFNNVLRYMMHAFNQSHMKLKDVEIIKVKRCEVIGPENVSVQVDGELIGNLPMKFRIHPNSLAVFCP
jgi:diacylglycerol kinase (ATP)